MTRTLDGLDQRIESVLVGGKHWPPAALVGGTGQTAGVGHQLARGAEHIRRDLESLPDGFGPGRHDHEVLHVGSTARMGPAAEDLDFRQRDAHRGAFRQQRPARQARSRRRRVQQRQRHRHNGVGTQPREVCGPVERGHGRIQPGLVNSVASRQQGCNLAIHRRHGAVHAQAAKTFAAIAQFPRLVRAHRGTGRGAGAAERAARQAHLRLDRGPASGVPDLSPAHRRDRGLHRARLPSAHTAATAFMVAGGSEISARAVARTNARSSGA